MAQDTLTIGHIAYANCEPFFHFLRDAGFDGTIRSGVPAQLNRFLSDGELDLSPSSSFEYLHHWRDYLLLPDLSISSIGAVKSVLLFSPQPLEALVGQEIFLTGESASSVRLLQVMLREYFGFEEVLCRVSHEDLEERVAEGRPALLIGDRALRMAETVDPANMHDLGELWHRKTGLPFVFALWIVRRDLNPAKNRQVLRLYRQLKTFLRRSFDDLSGVAHALPGYSWYGQQKLVDYWQAMSYLLDSRHLAGLKLYAELLYKYGFLDELPAFEFFDLAD